MKGLSMAVVNYPLRCFGAYGNRDMNFSPKRDDIIHKRHCQSKIGWMSVYFGSKQLVLVLDFQP